MKMTFQDFINWEISSKDTIDFKKVYVDMADDLIAGLVLSELIYWYLPSKYNKPKLRVMHEDFYWVAVKYKDWWERARITASQSERAVDILVKKGLVTKKVFKFDGTPVVHLRVNEEVFLDLLYKNLVKTDDELPTEESRFRSQPKSISVTAEVDSPFNGESLTKTTTETTTEVKKDHSSFSQNSEPKKSTSADEYKERIRNAMVTGIEDHKKKTQNGEAYVANFPADVQDVIGRICKLWMITPPQKSSSSFGFWIKAARELRTTCGEYGLDIIDEVFDNIPPEMVSGPASLINMARARVAEHNRTVAPIDPGADDLSYHWDSSLTVEENERLMNEKRQKVAQEGG